MLANIRQAAWAIFVGGCFGCIIDVVLAASLNVVGVSGQVPLWSLVPERVAARGLWLTTPPLLWITARPIAAWLDAIFADGVPPAPFSRARIWKLVGLLMITAPPLLVAAGWGGLLLRITLSRSWAFEGAMFLTPALYSTPLLAVAPTVLAGTTLRELGRHLDPG